MYAIRSYYDIIGSSKHSITTYLIGGLGVSLYPYDFDPVALDAVGAYADPAGDDNVITSYSIHYTKLYDRLRWTQ